MYLAAPLVEIAYDYRMYILSEALHESTCQMSQPNGIFCRVTCPDSEEIQKGPSPLRSAPQLPLRRQKNPGLILVLENLRYAYPTFATCVADRT